MKYSSQGLKKLAKSFSLVFYFTCDCVMIYNWAVVLKLCFLSIQKNLFGSVLTPIAKFMYGFGLVFVFVRPSAD